jgi:hypothetical protein
VKRRLFTILSALSLLLFVAVVVLWVRSYQTPEEVRWRVEEGGTYERWSASNRDGWLTLRTVRLTPAAFAIAHYDVEPPFSGIEGGIEYSGRWVNDGVHLRPQIVDFRDKGDRLTVAREFLAFFPLRPSGTRERKDWRAWGIAVYQGSGLAGPVWEPLLMFGASKTEECVQRSSRSIRIAYWLLAGLTAVLPSLWVSRVVPSAVRRRWRASSGRCPSCGYDLRATPGRCPECGTVALGHGDPQPADEVK